MQALPGHDLQQAIEAGSSFLWDNIPIYYTLLTSLLDFILSCCFYSAVATHGTKTTWGGGGGRKKFSRFYRYFKEAVDCFVEKLISC
jgi:hypothetical protein